MEKVAVSYLCLMGLNTLKVSYTFPLSQSNTKGLKRVGWQSGALGMSNHLLLLFCNFYINNLVGSGYSGEIFVNPNPNQIIQLFLFVNPNLTTD